MIPHFVLRMFKRELVREIDASEARHNRASMPHSPRKHRGGALYVMPGRATRGDMVRVILAALACAVGCTWTLAGLPDGWHAAWRLIATCVACEVLAPPRRE